MEIALPTSLPLLLLLLSSPTAVPFSIAPAGAGERTSGVPLFSPAAAPSSAMAPGADGCDIYIVFVRCADYIDSADYDVRLLASVVGSTIEAKKAVIYHYSGLGFAARLTPNQANQLSRKEGIATFKDKTYHVENDGRLPRSFEENI